MNWKPAGGRIQWEGSLWKSDECGGAIGGSMRREQKKMPATDPEPTLPLRLEKIAKKKRTGYFLNENHVEQTVGDVETTGEANEKIKKNILGQLNAD